VLLLGMQGSPRKKGNTEYLLNAFVAEAERLGARTRIIYANGMNVRTCRGCGFCEKKGYCVIGDDDMQEIYHLWRAADVVVAATPIFFYAFTAQIKAIIDRSQALWSRRYVFKLSDPASRTRQGFALALGATKGKNLFDGVHLTARYFFDAIHANYHGSLTYRTIEAAKDMEKHPSVREDVSRAAHDLLTPLLARKKILFVGDDNACGSQMAAAFTKLHLGQKLDAACAGISPAEHISADMAAVMAQKGIDMAFHRTCHVNQAIKDHQPEIIVAMSGKEKILVPDDVKVVVWDQPNPSGQGPNAIMSLCEAIEKQVIELGKGE
jgi:arsenate reductase